LVDWSRSLSTESIADNEFKVDDVVLINMDPYKSEYLEKELAKTFEELLVVLEKKAKCRLPMRLQS
jgi:hypothetical protein